MAAQKKSGSDPRNQPEEHVAGKGSTKTYRGTGQKRQSQRSLTDAQKEAIFNYMQRLAIDFNRNNQGEVVNFGGIDQDAFASDPKHYQPAWQADPWSMSQVGQAGGRPVDPTVAANMNNLLGNTGPKNFRQ